MFAWWRAFPQPGQVIFIDVDERVSRSVAVSARR